MLAREFVMGLRRPRQKVINDLSARISGVLLHLHKANVTIDNKAAETSDNEKKRKQSDIGPSCSQNPKKRVRFCENSRPVYEASEDEPASTESSTQYAHRPHSPASKAVADGKAHRYSTSSDETPTLSENISIPISAFVSGSREWKNDKSAQLEFCVDKTAFEPRDGNQRDSQMNPYRNHTEFAIRPLEISTLVFDQLNKVQLTKGRRRSFGGPEATRMTISFRSDGHAMIFAAMLSMYNPKMEMVDQER